MCFSGMFYLGKKQNLLKRPDIWLLDEVIEREHTPESIHHTLTIDRTLPIHSTLTINVWRNIYYPSSLHH